MAKAQSPRNNHRIDHTFKNSLMGQNVTQGRSRSRINGKPPNHIPSSRPIAEFVKLSTRSGTTDIHPGIYNKCYLSLYLVRVDHLCMRSVNDVFHVRAASAEHKSYSVLAKILGTELRPMLSRRVISDWPASSAFTRSGKISRSNSAKIATTTLRPTSTKNLQIFQRLSKHDRSHNS